MVILVAQRAWLADQEFDRIVAEQRTIDEGL
jgi:hypothetical protein